AADSNSTFGGIWAPAAAISLSASHDCIAREGSGGRAATTPSNTPSLRAPQGRHPVRSGRLPRILRLRHDLPGRTVGLALGQRAQDAQRLGGAHVLLNQRNEKLDVIGLLLTKRVEQQLVRDEPAALAGLDGAPTDRLLRGLP